MQYSMHYTDKCKDTSPEVCISVTPVIPVTRLSWVCWTSVIPAARLFVSYLQLKIGHFGHMFPGEGDGLFGLLVELALALQQLALQRVVFVGGFPLAELEADQPPVGLLVLGDVVILDGVRVGQQRVDALSADKE